MKIAFIYNPNKLSGKLTKLFTDSFCYHCGWVDEERDLFFDMHLIRRVRIWSDYSHGKDVKLVESPVPVSFEYLFGKLKSDENTYGVIDYVLFALRPLFHLIGKSTPNAKGVICSEMIYDDLKANGWQHEFKEVPSPADLEKALNVA